MAPQRVLSRKRKSATASHTSRNSNSSADVEQFPMPPPSTGKRVPTKTGLPLEARTPIRKSPQKQRKGVISLAQKQALIDNLQLEITERARKLRAQYALQAQGLRTKLEIRIHRIPAALRKAKLGDLIEKHLHEDDGPQQKPTVPVTKQQMQRVEIPAATSKAQHKTAISPLKEGLGQKDEPHARLGKRRSSSADDKENTTSAGDPPSKRLRGNNNNSNQTTMTNAPTTGRTNHVPTANTARRQIPPSQILSPKSANARAPPPPHQQKHSPFRPTTTTTTAGTKIPSPQKPSQPPGGTRGSPLKPGVPSVAVAPTAASLAKTSDKPRGKNASAIAGTRTASRAGAGGPSAAARGARGRMQQRQQQQQQQQRDGGHEEETDGRGSSASENTNASVGTTIVRRGAGGVSAKTRTAPVPTARGAANRGRKVGSAGRAGAAAPAAVGKSVRGRKPSAVTAKGNTTTGSVRGKPGTTTAAAKAKAKADANAGETVKGGRTLRKRA